MRVKTHEALMRMRKDELVELATDHARRLKTAIGDPSLLDKRPLAHLVIVLAKRLSAREGLQGE